VIVTCVQTFMLSVFSPLMPNSGSMVQRSYNVQALAYCNKSEIIIGQQGEDMVILSIK
jgi:hypothetical protein